MSDYLKGLEEGARVGTSALRVAIWLIENGFGTANDISFDVKIPVRVVSERIRHLRIQNLAHIKEYAAKGLAVYQWGAGQDAIRNTARDERISISVLNAIKRKEEAQDRMDEMIFSASPEAERHAKAIMAKTTAHGIETKQGYVRTHRMI